MAGNITNFHELQILEFSVGKNPALTRYVALYTTSPTDATDGVEVTTSGTGYARISRTAGDWNSAVSGAITNATDIRLPSVGEATAPFGSCVALAIVDAPTGGNILWYGPLTATVSVNTGDHYRIAASGLTISID